MAGNTDSANLALTNNPQLTHQPGLASDAINSTNPSDTAALLLHSNNMTSTQQSINDNIAQNDNGGIWNNLFKGASNVVKGGLTWLSKPLNEIQRDYKFVHSVWVRHGAIEGFMAAAGIAGGATLGFFGGGVEGAMLGADAAGAAERNLVGRFGSNWKDSFNDSNDPNYKVSFGRDVAHGIGAVPGLGGLDNTDKGMGKLVSGFGDAAFDMGMDPTIIGFKAKAGIASGKYLVKAADGAFLTTKLPLAKLADGVQGFLERNSLKTFGSTDQINALYQAGKNPTVLDRAFGGAGKQYVRATEDIADMANKPGGLAEIGVKFPGLQGLVEHLKPTDANPVTGQDVHKVFLQAMGDDAFNKNYMSVASSFVPNRTVMRSALSTAADKLRQWDSNDELYLRGNQSNFFLPRKAAQVSIDENGLLQQAADKTWNMPVALRPWSADAWKSAIAGKVRTFSGYLPYTIDDKTLELSNSTFDPSSSNIIQPLYRIFRFSMSDQMAKQKVTEFMNAGEDIASKKRMYIGAINEMFKAAGIPDDSKFVMQMRDKLGQYIDGPIGKNEFGYGFESGEKVSQQMVEQGSINRGLYEDHAGNFAMPNFAELKNAMRATSRYGKIYGAIDRWAADHYTDGFFKPLALLTTGFGIRIATSELLPSIFRFGGVETAKSKVTSAAAKMNYKLAARSNEHEAILENATHALAGGSDTKSFLADAAAASEGKKVSKMYGKALSKLSSPEDLELASQLAIATRGHMGTGVTLTGYGAAAEQQESLRKIAEVVAQQGEKKAGMSATQFQQELRKAYNVTGNKMLGPQGDYSFFTNVNHRFDLHWYTELSKTATTASRRQITADALDAFKQTGDWEEAWKIARQKDEARIRRVEYDPKAPDGLGASLPKGAEDPYARERKLMAGYSDPSKFAYDRVDNIRNTFTSRGDINKVHTNFMEKVANGDKVSLNEIKNLEVADRPRAIAGQEYQIMPGQNLHQRVVNFGFHHIIDPIVNNLSREPLFFNHVKNEMATMRMAIDTGKVSEEEGLRIAMTRASHAMLPQIHNTSLRTQFSVLARNYLPFYFAQEQAMRRAGSLILKNPNALRQYQLVQQGVSNPAFVETDSSGQRTVNIPFAGEIGAAFLSGASALGLPVVGGLPVTVTGSLSSLKTVLPEAQLPGVSPFVTIAANSIDALDPVLGREIKKLTGNVGTNQSMFDSLIPNSFVRGVYHAANANEQETSFYNAIVSSIASASFHGQIPGADASPQDKQAFLDRIKNNARSILMMKAVLGAVSPLAPSVSQEDPGLRDEFYKLLKTTSPVTGKPMTYIEALDKFIAEHGSGAISYTISKSLGTTPGATMPYTDQAIKWIESHQDVMNSTGPEGTAAAFLVPQATSGSGDAQAIHDEIVKMHLRSNKTPQQFLDSYYTAAGNNFIASQRKGHDDAMAALAKNGQSQSAERAAWSAFVTQYGQTNPIWWDDYSSTTKKHVATEALTGFNNMFAGKTDQQINSQYGSQALDVKNLYNDYLGHHNAILQLRANGATSYEKAENDNWQQYLAQIVSNNPTLNTVVNSVFARLG